MKRYFFRVVAICFAIFAFTPVMPVVAKEHYWYVKRNAEHKQPILDKGLSYIEECGGIYLDKNYGDDASEKVIYLTFDVGYENGNVAKIMDVMKDEGVKGSFFILGNVIDRAPELVKRMADEGHSVCNHTTSHQCLVGKPEEALRGEIETLEKKYTELTGREMSKYFRPPEGAFDKELLQRVEKLGYKTVFWSFAYADWDNDSQMCESAAMELITKNLHNGEIMLLHPTGETNAKIMRELITLLKSQGYRFATLNEIK